MGEPGRPPVIFGIPLADIQAGVFAAVAVLAAVAGRGESGEGVHVDLSMFDIMVSLLGHVGTLFLNTGIEQTPQGSAHPFITPWQAFKCADGAYIVVAPREERFWQQLVEALDVDSLRAPEYATATSRTLHRDSVLEILSTIFLEQPSTAWLSLLEGADVPVAPVRGMPQVFADPVLVERGLMKEVTSRTGETLRMVGNALKVDAASLPEPRYAPALGADTDEILGDLLEYSKSRIDELRERRVVT